MSDCSSQPTYNFFVNYVVWFTDESLYSFAVGSFGASFSKNPEAVSAALGVPIYDGPSPPGPNGWNEGFASGMFVLSYNGFSGIDVGNPGHPVILPTNVDSINVPCYDQGNGMVWANRVVYWAGSMILMTPAPTNPQPDTDATIPIRRWITGFESEFGAEGPGNSALVITRDASRTVNGLGAAIRSSVSKFFLRSTSVYRTGLTPVSSWERFYLRVRAFDVANIDIWKCDSSPSPSAGIRLYLKPDGSVDVVNNTASNVETVLANTGPIFEQDVFVRLDLLLYYNSLGVGGSGSFRLFANGTELTSNVVGSASGGIGQNSTYHLQSRLGTAIASVNTWELDFDDWTCMDIPVALIDGVLTETLNTVDWLGGTHVKLVRSSTGTTVNWTGQAESMNQMMSPVNASSNSRLTSTSALAELTGEVELLEGTIDFSGYQIAPISFIVAKYGTRLTNNGKLGYNLAGAGDTLATITESASPIYNTVAYLATGTDFSPPVLSPLTIIHQKGNGSDLATVYALEASVEYIGLWGTEDNPLVPQLPTDKFLIHNGAYYANSPWNALTPGEGLVCVHSGIYIGNDTFQTIECAELPFHFLFVRPLTGGSKNGFRWFATGLGGHLESQDSVDPESPVHVYWDQDSLTAKFTVVGKNADVNALGVSYQWLVFADPTTRYNICGAFVHATTTTIYDNPLFNSLFQPDACFTQFENTAAASTNIRLAYKGPGHSADAGTRLDGTALSNFLTFFQGILESHADAHNLVQTTYSAWRVDDGSVDVMIQITSYTGDGTGNRNITLTPTSNRYPGWAFVQPHNSEGIFRDPSHTGSNSGKMNSAVNNVASGIIGGGVDTLQVGSTLNANGIVYDVFVIPGSPTGWNQFDWCSNQTPPTPTIPPIPPGPIPTPIPDIAFISEGGIILGAHGGTPTTLIIDPTGIYKYVPGSTCDLVYDRAQMITIDLPIPGVAKGGYIGG